MKKEFIGYYQLNDREHESLWKNAVIVFDTNVLLDLYRYRKSTRDDLIKVMEQFKDRLFVPHHVMLEFHRNRRNVIAGQYNKFDKVKSLVQTKIKDLVDDLEDEKLDERHSDIELDTFTKELNKSAEKLFEELDKTKKKSLGPNGSDKILSRIEKLFSKKVGESFDEKTIEKIYHEGEMRYKSQIPPGYKDNKKDEEYRHNQILIKKKFGDLIIWKQILDYCLKNKNTDIIFVTSDVKDDWFWKEKGQTIKCHPELTEEICNSTSVDRFKIYKTERFLEYASKFLGSKLDDKVLSDVKSVSSRTNAGWSAHSQKIVSNTFVRSEIYEKAVFRWLLRSGKNPTENFKKYPDFVVRGEEFLAGYEVKAFKKVSRSLANLTSDIRRAHFSLEAESFNMVSIVYVTSNEDDSFWGLIKRAESLALPEHVSLVFGKLDSLHEFVPLHVVSSSK